jgi:sporulation-control protein
MVFKKLLSSLGFGGVEVDTVLAGSAGQPGAPGSTLSGQVHLRAKGDVDITSIQLLLVATGAMGEVELGRFTVAGGLRLGSGAVQALPFSIVLPAHTPVTVLYGQNLPGVSVGVRTEVAVAGGTGKTDFDPFHVAATEAHQHIIDALGTIGCRFVRNELRPAGQAITFYAPVPEGQQVGPHIPQLTFLFAADPQGMDVTAELAARPGAGDRHRVTPELAGQLSAQPNGWVEHVDKWVTEILAKLATAPGAGAGSFMQPAPASTAPPAPGYAPSPGRRPYQYAGAAPAYQYGGYRGGGFGVGSMVASGVGGAALGFLGGMMIADMMQPDVNVHETINNYDTPADGQDSTDTSYQDASYDDSSGGYDDYGGGYDDFGGGDFGGGDF